MKGAFNLVTIAAKSLGLTLRARSTLPSRYNTATELGAEICRDDPNADKLTLDLKDTP